jgi:magnesium-transporting ATPase (P-type)
MTVVKLWIADRIFDSIPKHLQVQDSVLTTLVEGISLNSTAYIENKGNKDEFIGNKSECALLFLARSLGVDYKDIRREKPIEKVFPFSSKKKRMSTIVKNENGSYRLYCKGASEVVLARCSQKLNGDGSVDNLSEESKQELLKLIETWASEGLRTLTLAYSDSVSLDSKEEEDVDQDLILVGIVGIEDPLRPEVPNSVRTCQKAGITVRMLTVFHKIHIFLKILGR